MDIVLRIPALENIGGTYGNFLSSGSVPLTTVQIATAQQIFRTSLNYGEIRIAVSNVVSAPTTLGNYIRIRGNSRLDDATLIHELTHVWQFQNRGNRYISDSLTNQGIALLTTLDRNNAYKVRIVPGKNFSQYEAEHQAMIVENYFTGNFPQTEAADYERMIAQVRSAIPNITPMDRYIETLYGPNFNPDRPIMPSMMDDSTLHTAPLFRLEWTF